MSGVKDNVILLDGLDLLMHKDDLKQIAEMHNSGSSLREIEKKMERNPYEIIAAILEWTRQGHYMRAFGAQKESTLLIPGKELLKKQEEIK